ncbi:LCP family protein [bacterium]|nr:LCP family protein [bacterium]MDY3757595.1 LCP family protein [Bacilli bacterium]
MAKKQKKTTNKFYKILSFILVFITVLAVNVIIYFNVLPNKYLIPAVIVVGLLTLVIALFLNKKTKIFAKMICTIASVLILAIEALGIFYAFGTIDFFNDIFDNGVRSESYAIYVKEDSTFKTVNDIKRRNIAVFNPNEENVKTAVSLLENMIKFKKVDYESQTDAINSVLNDENVALIMQEALMDIFLDEHPDTKLRVLDTIDVKTKTMNKFKKVDVTKDSFVIYLSGVDTSGTVRKSARSDVNVLAFVNPDNSKILLLSTPRDYYVTLATKNAKDKLTHAGIYGVEESSKTLGKLYGVDVNYYARVNFTSFVKIINNLGGITVDVEKPDYRYSQGIDCGSGYVCTDNSKRENGNNVNYIKYGTQKLTGEQALTYARNRYQYKEGDNARQLHQQQILKAMMTKALSSSNTITKYNTILKDLSKGLITNVDQDTITKLINMQLNENIKWQIDTYAVTGTGASKKTYSTGNYNVYVMEPNEESIAEAKQKIKEVMES